MAIKPPSDIVLDVVRAADPTRQRAAVAKLTRAPSSQPSHEFASLVGGVRPPPEQGACNGAMAQDNVPDAFRAFEAFFIRSFVENMLPQSSGATYGSGTAGEVWRSQLAEKMGDEIAKAGGIGIADRLATEQGKNQVEISGVADEPGISFSLADQLSHAAPFGAWASYLPFLAGQTSSDPGQAAPRDPARLADDA